MICSKCGKYGHHWTDNLWITYIGRLEDKYGHEAGDCMNREQYRKEQARRKPSDFEEWSNYYGE